MDQREILAFELVGRLQFYRDKKLTAKQAREALARLVEHADAVMAAEAVTESMPQRGVVKGEES